MSEDKPKEAMGLAVLTPQGDDSPFQTYVESEGSIQASRFSHQPT